MSPIEEKPLVSVIIPCYNHEKYIEECLRSVMSQTYNNLQIIVIDDGSQDQSFEIAQKVLTYGNSIVVKQSNIGLPRTINRALKEFATGSFIVILASDDWLDSTSIEKQVNCFQLNNNLGFVFGKAMVVGANGKYLYEIPSLKRRRQITFNELLKENFVPALATMIKKSALYDVGLYDINSKIEDWDMWLRLGLKYEFQFIDELLGFYRQHPNQTSTKYDLIDDSEIYILNKHQHLPIYKEAYNTHLLRSIRNRLPAGKKKACLMLMKNIFLINKREYWSLVFKLLIS